MLRSLRNLLFEIVDPDRDGPLRPSVRQITTLAVYAACSAVYIAIGIVTIDFLLSFWVAIAYLLVMAWLIPAGVKRVL